MTRIAIFSLERDLHAHAVLHSLRARGIACEFVATDMLSLKGGIRWQQGKKQFSQLLSDQGQWFDISSLDVIWWRRVNQPQRFEDSDLDPASVNLIENDWRASLNGAVHDAFS